MSSRRAQQDIEAINEQIRQEHEQLRALLGSVSHTLLARQVPVDGVVRQLAVLRDELETHFRHEESEGFFKEITEHAPRLSIRTDRLCDEHVEMLGEIDRLLDQAMQGDGSEGWWCFMGGAFHDFGKMLMRHEREENQLLQQAYTDDIGSKD